jgi:DNA-binding MarR family transcriptional regulator
MDQAGLTAEEQRAWFGLLAVVAQALPEVERTTRRHGLVYFEYLLLAELATAPDGHRMSDLARCVQASPSRLSHRMRKLAELGYAERSRFESDGRVSVARITERGRRVVDEVSPAIAADVRRLVLDPLQPNQVTALADVLGAIADRLAPPSHDHEHSVSL